MFWTVGVFLCADMSERSRPIDPINSLEAAAQISLSKMQLCKKLLVAEADFAAALVSKTSYVKCCDGLLCCSCCEEQPLCDAAK